MLITFPFQFKYQWKKYRLINKNKNYSPKRLGDKIKYFIYRKVVWRKFTQK